MKNCWNILDCNKHQCPAYGNADQNCWLIPGTQCHDSAQGKFSEKMELCLKCDVFDPAASMSTWEETLHAVNDRHRPQPAPQSAMSRSVTWFRVFSAVLIVLSLVPSVIGAFPPPR